MKSTSEIILDCVISKIKTGEVFDISMSEIANLADIGKSTIYEYFTNKEDMIYSALCKMIDNYTEKFLACSLDKNFKECFFEHISCIIEISEECSALERILRTKVLNNQKYRIEETVKPCLNIFDKRVNEIAKKGYDEGIILSKYDNIDNKIMTISLIQGLIVNFISGRIEKRKEEVIIILYDNVLKIVNN